MSKTKRCSKCGKKRKLPNDFSQHRSHRDGFSSWCKKCTKADYDANHEERLAVCRKSHQKHRDKQNAGSRRRFKNMLINEPERILWYKAKERAKEQQLPFDLTPEDLLVPKICPVLGIPLIHGKGKWADNSPTVDRILPGLGYIKGNVCVISWRANDLKKNGTLEEFRKIVAYLEGARVITLKATQDDMVVSVVDGVPTMAPRTVDQGKVNE